MDENLCILAFDHRSSLKDNILNAKKRGLAKKEISELRNFKDIIYDGLKLSIKNGMKKSYAAVLVDEDYGNKVLRKAKKDGIKIILPVEKSSQVIFDFNFGNNFRNHIEKFNPDYVKVLISYNPINKRDNLIQLKRLKVLYKYLNHKKRKFLLEVLIKPTEKEKRKYKDKFDSKIRPRLTLKTIKEIQNFGIFPDVWKLEGFDKEKALLKVVKFANLKKKSYFVILGRSESMSKVLKWISTGARVKNVIGFAVGRTIFMSALKKYHHKKISKTNAVKIISERYLKISNYWFKNRKLFN